MKEIDLNNLEKGDTIIFADGTKGICTVSYNNGGSRFIRWDEPGKDWSGSDSHCCISMMPNNGRMGYIGVHGNYVKAPKDIIDIIKKEPKKGNKKIITLHVYENGYHELIDYCGVGDE
jgi:hypothetical protein